MGIPFPFQGFPSNRRFVRQKVFDQKDLVICEAVFGTLVHFARI